MMASMTTVHRTYSGGCHCGAVRFEVAAPDFDCQNWEENATDLVER